MYTGVGEGTCPSQPCEDLVNSHQVVTDAENRYHVNLFVKMCHSEVAAAMPLACTSSSSQLHTGSTL